MSAASWTQCPRCLKRRAMEVENKTTQVEAAYGNVSVEQFDRLRGELETLKADKLDSTFREDYEIYGAADGVVEVRYSGGCQTCKLSLTFEHSHEIDVAS